MITSQDRAPTAAPATTAGSTPWTRDQARAVLDRAHDLQARVATVSAGRVATVTAVRDRFAAVRQDMLVRELVNIPVTRLREATDGRLRLGVLEKAGYRSVHDVYMATPAALEQIPGVGSQTATQAVAAARQVADAVKDGLKVRIDLDPGNTASTALLQAVHHQDQVERVCQPLDPHLHQLSSGLAACLRTAVPARSKVRMFFTGTARKVEIRAALTQLHQWTTWAATTGYRQRLDQATTEQDLAARAALLGQAEKIAMDETAAFPIYWYIAQNVVSPEVTGFVNNASDIHRTRWLSKAE